MSDLPTSRHFTLEPLADGVFAAIALDGGWAIGNSGIIDLGDSTLVFDTFITPAAARDLKSAAEQLTGKPVRYVVNSHYHNDHIRGNQVFDAETVIISTTATRDLIQTDGAEELKWDTETAAKQAQKLAEQMAAAASNEERSALVMWRAYFDGIARSLDELQIRLPNLTFDDRLILHGAARTVELVCLGGGHTKSDTVLVLPGERIAFLSDLLFVDCHPFLADGNPHDLLACLNKLMDYDLVHAVPGHGPVGTVRHLQQNAAYVNAAIEMAQQGLSAGKTPDELSQIAVPEPFGRWRFANFFASNMRFLHQFLSQQ